MGIVRNRIGNNFVARIPGRAQEAELKSYFALMFATRKDVAKQQKSLDEIFALCGIQTKPDPTMKTENISGRIDEILYGKA